MDAVLRYPAYILAGIRNKFGRNLAAVICFALIAANVFTGQYLVAGEVESLDQGVSRLGADLIVVPVDYGRFHGGTDADDTMALVAVLPSPADRFDAALLDAVASAEGVANVSPQLYAGRASVPELAAEPIPVYGIDPLSDLTVRSWLADPLVTPLGPGEVIAGGDLRRSTGDVVPIGGRDYHVVGVLDETRSLLDGALFFPLDDARALAASGAVAPEGGAGEVSAGLVRLAPGADPDAIVFALDRRLAPMNLVVVERHFTLDPVSEGLRSLPGFLNIVSGVVLVAAFPLIALIAAMVANERQREIGILRAMGATGRVIVLLVMAESLVLAALGAVAGVAASLAALTALEANGVLNSALQVSFRVPAAGEIAAYAAVTFLVVIAMGTLSSAYPAYRTGRLNPFDAIRVEGK